MNKIHLLLADDHQLFLDGLISLLRNETAFEIDTASDGYEVLEKVKRHSFDICLLDIGMPKMDGIAVARALQALQSKIQVIILSTYNDKEIIKELIKSGISGYLMKNCTRQELLEAIYHVYNGGRHFSHDIQSTLVTTLTSYLNSGKTKNDVVLTPREIEIVKFLAREYTNEKIAAALNISFRTVETHRKNIMQKTNSRNLAGLLKFAYEQKLI
jgi:DNA-binding NarL/FixJ family response regulator